MGLAEGATDLEFLADGERLLRAHDLQLPDAAALAPLQGDEVQDLTEVLLQLAADEFGELLLGVFHRPTVEVGRLLVVVVEHAREDLLVAGVAVGVVEGDEVGLRRVFPAVLELLGLTATALMEAGVADLVSVGEHLSARRGNGLRHLRTAGHRDALVTLAVVVGADIVDGVVFAVVPADDLIFLLDEREETVAAVLMTAALLHLCQEPGTGDDGVGLEELGGGRGRHLTGDDTREVALHGEFVDGHDLIGLDDDGQRSLERLPALALPVEVHADGDVVEREVGIVGLGTGGEVTVLRASPEDATLGELHRLGTADHLALGHILALEFEGDLVGTHDADGDRGLLGEVMGEG